MGLFKAFLTLIGITLLASEVFANTRVPNEPSFQMTVQGTSTSNKDDIFKRLLSTEDLSFSWPNFPRTWHEQSVQNVVNTNVSVGLSLGKWGPAGFTIARGSTKFDIEYRYGIKSSLVLILPRSIAKTTDPSKKEIVAPDSTVPEMFKFDATKNRTYPNTDLGIPMVGFCSFEATLSYTASDTKGMDFLVFGASHTNSDVQSISHTVYSQFFQVDGTMSVMEMRDEICVKRFRNLVRKQVEGDFAKAVLEFKANYSKQNECRPSPGQDTNEEGDLSCRDWMANSFPAVYKKLAVPRCLLSSDGIHRCALRARAGKSCPMSWSRANHVMVPSETVSGREYYAHPKATSSQFEFPCDKAAGLECRAESNPTLLLNMPIISGTARCR